MAVTAGALMAAPHGHAAPPATHTAVAEAIVTAKTDHVTSAGAGSAAQAVVMGKAALAQSARHTAAAHTAASQSYTVRSGDTLSSIAGHFYGKSGDWQWLYHVNSKALTSPNLIYPRQVLNVPASAPADYTLPATEAAVTASAPSGYQARHATPVEHGSDAGGGSRAASTPATVSRVSRTAAVTSAGTYSCRGLEALWEEAGGSAGQAAMAASIAMAESGGDANAISPTDDFGLWQINASHGSEATLDPLGNARAAIDISGNGSNWGAWTTFTSGVYSGRC